MKGLGFDDHQPDLEDAWEPVLFNQAHDLASGVMVDKVFEDAIRAFDYSKHRAETILDEQLDKLLARIDTRGDGIPIVVFNPLGWSRSDIAETNVSFSERGISDFSLVDAAGKSIPIQVIEAQRNGDGAGPPPLSFTFAICSPDMPFTISSRRADSLRWGRFLRPPATWRATPLRIRMFNPSRTTSIALRSTFGPVK